MAADRLNFVLIKQLGLIDTLLGISLPTMLMTPFAVFFLRQFFMNVPVELEEAALLDGSSKIGNFFRLILPVSAAPIATISLLTAGTLFISGCAAKGGGPDGVIDAAGVTREQLMNMNWHPDDGAASRRSSLT